MGAWCEHALAPVGEYPAKHHRLLIDALTDVANGDCKRLIICMPPGSAKSTYASVLFPIWLMGTKPNHKVILASYAASLAETHSEKARALIHENADILGTSIPKGKNSVKRWATTNKSEYKCVGAGSAITGLRADTLIIDDPFAGREEADSPTHRNKIWSWYRANVLTRLRKNASVLIICTRWHEDDLVGRLLQDQPEKWRVISVPALCDDPENDLLGRELNEPMWPEWQPLEDLEQQRRDIGEREFISLYQQKPVPDGGALIQVNKIGKIDYDPALIEKATTVRAWDFAASSTLHTRNPDWTVGVLMAKTKEGRYVILDVVRCQGEPSTVERLVLETAARDGKGVSISIPVDPGSSGKSYAAFLARELAGYDVHTSRETGTKIARATAFIAQANSGNVLMVNGRNWNEAYLDELACFPSGLKDDQVDATSRGFSYIISKSRRGATFMRLNYFRT